MTGRFAIVLICLAANLALAAGDPERGRELSAQCFACHGVDGNSPSPVNPKIGGQHEEYLLLAMRGYADGSRPNSLMSGAVLNKSDQDLRDIAAYFSSRAVAVAPAAPQGAAPAAGGSRGPQRGGGPRTQFDHGDRDSDYTSMLARASGLITVQSEMADADLCRSLDGKSADDADDDQDGLPNRFDAAPNDAGEFVRDLNKDDRLEICNIHQLQAIATFGSAADEQEALPIDVRRARSYQLVRDLDASGLDFEPIGDCGPTGNCMIALGEFGFAGVFDGRGYTISNLSISRGERGGIGLFGVLAPSGVVMNLNLDNVEIVARAGAGTIVGSNFGTVYNCRATGTVEGAMAIGGLVGGSAGLIYGSRFIGRVTGKQAVGGLVGDMTGGVYYSRAEAVVSGQRGIGGLVGLSTYGSILDSSADSRVFGDNDIGGLVGVNTDARVRNSLAVGNVAGRSNNIGGLIGFNSQSQVRNSYARGDVEGVDAVGGLVGRNNGVIENSYAVGAVSGSGQTGALVGVIVDGKVEASFAANVSGGSDAGAAAYPAELDGSTTGWAPEEVPVSKPLQYFCDRNRNGYIDPAEWNPENYIWAFGRALFGPAIRCVPGGIDWQRT